MSSLKKEVEEHASRCAAEAEQVQEEFTVKEHQLNAVEKEAEEFVKVFFGFLFVPTSCIA